MTTYAGKSAQYVPGRDVPNKEPPVSKFVVEKLYRVHRLRMRKIEPLVDCHVVVPDFLTNTTWKKNAENARKAKIASQNLYMFHRISKVENEESQYKKETRTHVKRIEHKALYLKKLKVQDRQHKNYKIQRENEYILKRIEQAQPEYTKKKMDEWYNYHKLFKLGRRTDPTAGHIMHGMGNLLPPKLAPLNSVTGSFDLASSVLTGNGSVYSPKHMVMDGFADPSVLGERQSLVNRILSAPDAGRMPGHMGNMGMGRGMQSQSAGGVGLGGGLEGSLMQQSLTEGGGGEGYQGTYQGNHSHSNQQMSHSVHSLPQTGQMGQMGQGQGQMGQMQGQGQTLMPQTNQSARSQGQSGRGNGPSLSQSSHTPFSNNRTPSPLSDKMTHSKKSSKGEMAAELEQALEDLSADDDALTKHSLLAATEDLLLLISRPFALPFESKNCLVQVYTSKSYDESLQLKVVSSGISPQILCERTLHIDKAYEVVNAGTHSSHMIHSSENEDLASLSALLINMFQEADDDDSGSLTFDEFQVLMEQVELGISPQELRFVISEADENENGVVDYEEFVPLAVDLIQSFRARNRAKHINSELDVELDDLIMRSISMKDIEKSAQLCLDKIYLVDTKRYGLIRAVELKRCLNSVALHANLKENEVSMICQMLPRDQFDRCKYNSPPSTFLETLSKVRFMTMKNAMIESQGSGLQKYLLDLCRDEEIRITSEGGPVRSRDNFLATGNIPFRALINILTNSSRLSLSRLQVLVIMSEAHVQEGMINYFQFVPVVSKAIEIMFEPKALRQRAELIEKTDLSPEALLQGMSSEMFEQRLMTLFKSYDIDHSGGLDQNEFIACLESLDLQLSYAEMVALMASADTEHTGLLKFGDFVGFFTHNLLSLEREKHLRLLQSSMNAQAPVAEKGHISAEVTSQEQEDFMEHLSRVFKLSDPEESGFISFEEFEGVLRSFNVNASKYLMDVMLSELHIDQHGLLEYNVAVSSCGELLKVCRARESAHEEHKLKEDWAEAKAEEIIKSHEVELNHIVNYLKARIRRINEDISEPTARYNELVSLFRSSASGLGRFEANRLIAQLLTEREDMGAEAEWTATEVVETAPAVMVSVAGMGAELGMGALVGTGVGAGAVEAHRNTRHSFGDKSPQSPHSPHPHPHPQPHLQPQPHPQPHPHPHSHLLVNNKHPTHSQAHPHASPHASYTITPKSVKHRRGSIGISAAGKAFRSHFNPQELYDAVYEARCITIMRGLLEEIDTSATQTVLLTALREEASVLKEAGVLSADSAYLPVKSCFKVLEDTHELRLNRSQILFIISWAECFDKDGHHLEVERFAEHAANIVSKLGEREMQETRAEVVTAGNFEEKKVLNGMREEELLKHLEYVFSLGVDEISPDKLREVLKSTPKLALSDRECTALLAPFNHGTDLFTWKDHLQSLVSMIVTLCRERVINRRMSLHVTSTTTKAGGATTAHERQQAEARAQLKTLADKLVNHLRIQMKGDMMVIHLPVDNEKRRTSQLTGEDGLYARADAGQNLLYAGVRLISWTTKDAIFHKPVSIKHASTGRMSQGGMSQGGRHGSNPSILIMKESEYGSMMSMGSKAHGVGGHGSSASVVTPLGSPTSSGQQLLHVPYTFTESDSRSLLVLVSVTSEAVLGGETQLRASVVSADGLTCLRTVLPVKLPSICMVDREAARQFAGAVADLLHVEEVQGAVHSTELKMKP